MGRVLVTFRSRFAMSRAGLAAVIGVALGVPSPLTGQGERSDWRAGRIDVGEHHLYVDCRGEGAPTVVFEAGMGASSLAWRHVQAALAGTTRACVYDRAGLGRSDPGPRPRDGRSIAGELHALLSATESGPYVMVGHSFGGYIARIYRDLYPQEVVGLALVESAHDDQWGRLPVVVRRLLDQSLPGLQAKADSARAGMLSVEGAAEHSFFSRQGEEVWREHRRQSADPDHLQAHVDELRSMDRTAEQVANVAPLGDLPLAVLSSAREFDVYRGSPIPVDQANRIWLELQSELAQLSTNVVHIVSMTGPHTIQYAEPGVVVGLLQELVQRARAR